MEWLEIQRGIKKTKYLTLDTYYRSDNKDYLIEKHENIYRLYTYIEDDKFYFIPDCIGQFGSMETAKEVAEAHLQGNMED